MGSKRDDCSRMNEYEEEGGIRKAAPLRVIPRDLADMLVSWEKDVLQYRVAATRRRF